MFNLKKKTLSKILNEEEQASDLFLRAQAVVWVRQLENTSDDILQEIVNLINKRLYQY